MTEAQLNLYKKLRRKLINRGIKKEYIPVPSKVKSFDNQKSYMLIKVLTEEIKNMNAWEHSSVFRQLCFDKYGYDFTVYSQVKLEIDKVIDYASKEC